MSRAMVWERYGDAWHCHGPMETGSARALASLIRDPASDDDDPHDARTFELDRIGTVADMDRDTFAALRPRSWIELRGQRAYITRHIDAETIEIYDDSAVEYRIVVAPAVPASGETP